METQALIDKLDPYKGHCIVCNRWRDIDELKLTGDGPWLCKEPGQCLRYCLTHPKVKEKVNDIKEG